MGSGIAREVRNGDSYDNSNNNNDKTAIIYFRRKELSASSSSLFQIYPHILNLLSINNGRPYTKIILPRYIFIQWVYLAAVLATRHGTARHGTAFTCAVTATVRLSFLRGTANKCPHCVSHYYIRTPDIFTSYERAENWWLEFVFRLWSPLPVAYLPTFWQTDIFCQ
jgi:hypothetical protein